MASVSNRVVKNKKKRASQANKPRGAKCSLPGFDLVKFSNDVLTHRHARGLTQRSLAKETGMTSAAVVFIENRRSYPIVTGFSRLCQYLKLQPQDYIPVK